MLINTIRLRARDFNNEKLSDNELSAENFGRDGNRLIFGPTWERDLVQKVVKGKKIQFFSAGALEMVRGDDGVDREEFVDKSTQFFWAEHRSAEAVIISFRGTEADKSIDVSTDLKLFKETLSVGSRQYGSVHSGTLNLYFWENAADHSMIHYYSRSVSALLHYSELSESCDYREALRN